MYPQMRNTPSGEPIPENYSGNAFRYPPIGSLQPMPPPQIEEEPVPTPGEGDERRLPVVIPTPEPNSAGSGGTFGWLAHSPGSEEWLLLGLCLLLMGETGKNELLPYLLLLLFLG